MEDQSVCVILRTRYYNSTRYAFVEFEDPRDVEIIHLYIYKYIILNIYIFILIINLMYLYQQDAFYKTNRRKIRGCQISIQVHIKNIIKI